MLTMMVGEVEYSSLFDKQVGNNIDFMVWGHIWYVAALIAVTLVLSNLLVGIAVSDIQARPQSRRSCHNKWLMKIFNRDACNMRRWKL